LVKLNSPRHLVGARRAAGAQGEVEAVPVAGRDECDGHVVGEAAHPARHLALALEHLRHARIQAHAGPDQEMLAVGAAQVGELGR
jgi:hypothetical protein